MENREEIENLIINACSQNQLVLDDLRIVPLKGKVHIEVRVEKRLAWEWFLQNQEIPLHRYAIEEQFALRISLEECEILSSAINLQMDQRFPDLDYELEVSSPGLFREFRFWGELFLFRNHYIQWKTEKGSYRGFFLGLEGIESQNFLINQFPELLKNRFSAPKNQLSFCGNGVHYENRFLFVEILQKGLLKKEASLLTEMLKALREKIADKESSLALLENRDIFTAEKNVVHGAHFKKIAQKVKIFACAYHELKRVNLEYILST